MPEYVLGHCLASWTQNQAYGICYTSCAALNPDEDSNFENSKQTEHTELQKKHILQASEGRHGKTECLSWAQKFVIVLEMGIWFNTAG